VKLIITEKDNAARRIAEILSEGTADTERKNGVNVYRWGDTRVIGLSGHVVGLDFPSEYSNWRDVEPVELIDAEIVTEPTQENIVETLTALARRADEAIIATDYDREGELIGKEAYELIDDEMAGPINRVRFSSITENEVKSAFAEPDDIDFDLAAAGEARQIIDLVWGAALTRFLSLSAQQLGEDFISVGRVQSPTLKLIVDREREIQAFDPETYWEIFADVGKNGERFEAQYFYEAEDGTEAERVWDEADATDANDRLRQSDSATVQSVSKRTRTDTPPEPFNTTAFISAAGSLGYSAQQAMSIAEELYTAGYVTYPRTDNTVYPEDLDPEDLLDAFVGTSAFGDDAESLLGIEDIEPTRGEEETTDHPPIHPTGEHPGRGELGEDEWEIYELIVRRFFATVAEPATWEHLRVVLETAGCRLKANGKRLVDPGYHAVYPYASTSENHVPAVEEGEQLSLESVDLQEKETQPPRRYGQSRLIKKMESMGVGTKCLTADTPVLHRNQAGDIVRSPVSDLFSENNIVMADGDTDIAINDSGPTTLSVEEQRERVTERQKTLISRRPLEPCEQVLRITTENGTFSVTTDHPIYRSTGNGFEVVSASELSQGDHLLSTRRGTGVDYQGDAPVVTWSEFASSCDISSKLYGSNCGGRIVTIRNKQNETQYELADRIGADRPAISDYENGKRDVPVWILGELDIRPDTLHGLNYELEFENPFPLYWSPELVRVIAHLLGDGSIHVDDEENIVDVRYHNTDRHLINQFVSDIQSLFGFTPTVSERDGRKEHYRTRYQVNLPCAVGRILKYIVDSIVENDCPDVPEQLEPSFVGALFDDEGHISREGKIFISNTDHGLLTGVSEMLSRMNIDTKLATNQHKLYIRGRQNVEQFLDVIPIAADEKFYRGLDRLREYDVTKRKARLLELTTAEPMTSKELATHLNISPGRVTDHVRKLRDSGHLKKEVEGSNRSKNGLRSIRYTATAFEESIYATILGYPAKTEVVDVEVRGYDGDVYDLTIDADAPNFAVQGGSIVHNSTRHNTIEKLYDRGYIEDDPPRPTALAEAVVEAAEEFADPVVSEEMTAELERDMTAIADGGATLSEVTAESREMLGRVFEELRESREEIGDHLQESLKADRELGPCPECGETLLVRRSRQGSYFVGCDGFPDCRFTLPLPSNGEPLVLEEKCEVHDTHHVKMLAGRDTFVHGCPRCAAEEADESKDRIIGACPDCGEAHGGELAIKQLRSGSRLVGCNRYPDCEYSLPLPRRGDIVVTEEYCEEHDLPELHVEDGDDEPWELGCPICNYQEFQAEQAIDDLEDVSGIGAATAEKLKDAGVDSPEDLHNADPESLADQVQGVTVGKIRDWQAQLTDAD